MKILNPAAYQALSKFQQCQNWESRTKLLIDYGLLCDDFPTAAQNDNNRISACSAASWLIGSANPVCRFQAYSTSKITKGLLALLLIRINHENANILQDLDITLWFTDLGLSKNISNSRRNGLQQALNMMQNLV